MKNLTKIGLLFLFCFIVHTILCLTFSVYYSQKTVGNNMLVKFSLVRMCTDETLSDSSRLEAFEAIKIIEEYTYEYQEKSTKFADQAFLGFDITNLINNFKNE
jgi:hypothetical protein